MILVILVLALLFCSTAHAWQNMYIVSIDSYVNGVLKVTLGNTQDNNNSSLIDSELILVDGKVVKSINVSGGDLDVKKLTLQVGSLSVGKHELKLCTKYQGYSDEEALLDDSKIFTIKKSNKATAVKIDEGKSLDGMVGTKIYLHARLNPINAQSKITWKSSNKNIATVNSKGVVTPKKAGKVTITAQSNKKKATIKINILPKSKVSSVYFVGDPDYLTPGDKFQFYAFASPTGAKTTFTWTSSNKKVATIDKNGLLTALKAGKTKITLKSKNGKKYSQTIEVYPSYDYYDYD